MVEWFNLLNPETRGYIWQVVFEPIISLLLEKSASATLVQYVITHTFHIAEREITVTPYDFYCMIGLCFEGVIFSLGVQLGIDMLGGGGSILLRPFATLTWCRTTCSFHGVPRRNVSTWLGLSFSI